MGYSFDLTVLTKFQKASDWMQDNLGLNNFVIARFLRTIMTVAFTLREVISFMKGIDRVELVIIACSLVVLVKMEFMSQRAEQSLKNRHGLMNPVVVEYALTRIIMQVIAIGSLAMFTKNIYVIAATPGNILADFGEWKELYWNIFGMLLFFVAYFSSCTPKPYKPGKLKKLIQSISDNTTQQALSLSPERILS